MLASISTPLKFLGLIVLLVEGILAALAVRASGIDFTILLVGMLISLFVLIGVGWSIVKPQAVPPSAELPASVPGSVAEEPAPNHKYDVFVSCPMAAHKNDTEYQRSREEAIQFETLLQTKCKFPNIYYAGRNLSSTGDFEAEDLSAEDVLNAIKQSKYFALIYLSKIVSSSLLETGCALALRKPSVYFVHSRDDVPFLMKKAEQAFPNLVKIYECEDMSAILKLLEKHAERLFPSTKH